MELLEREAAWHDLQAAWNEAASGSGRVVLVSGEAGIGKTTLIEAFVRGLAAGHGQGGGRLLWGACDALFTPRPLGPVYDMAASAGPELRRCLGPGASRAELFAAFLAELQAGPVVVVFEDVHWADEATLDLLKFVGRRVGRVPALLIMTFRDDELGPRHALRTVLGDLATSGAARRLALPPLSEAAVRALVGDRAIDAARLHQQTAGNPFFVTEVLAHGGAGQLPATVRDAVLARAARLSPSAQAVLQCAAVIGLRSELWLLASVTSAEAQAADECLAMGLLLDQGDRLAFRHELAREAILEAILPHHKAAMHRMILEALQAAPATRRDLARLAHHAEGTGDREAVLAYAPPAAEQAAEAGAHREAAALYALALKFAQDLPLAEHARLLEAYARECNVTELHAEGIRAYQAAIELWRSSGQTRKQAEVQATLSVLLRNAGRYPEAEQVSREAIELLEALPPGPELAQAYRCRAALRVANRELDEAIAWGERAIEVGEKFGASSAVALAHVAVGAARMFQDEAQGRAYLEHRLALAKQNGPPAHVANLFGYLSMCSAELHQFCQAERYLTEGLTFTADHGLDMFHRLMLAWRAVVHVHLGQWDSAADLALQSLRDAATPPVSRIPALVALGRLRARRGDPGVSAVLGEAAELARTSNLQHLGLVHAARVEAEHLAADPLRRSPEPLAGDWPPALREAQPTYELAVARQHPWFAGELAFWRWRAGHDEPAPGWLARPFALQIRGNWRAAANAWSALSCPYEQARALADGDSQAQAQALEIFERLGAWPAAQAVRQRLQAAGARLPRRPRAATRANPYGLTARQLDVWRLLAEGLSNAEIAARLHLSPKTVDHHVTAVLGKLDVHSRQAAAALARQSPHLLNK